MPGTDDPETRIVYLTAEFDVGERLSGGFFAADRDAFNNIIAGGDRGRWTFRLGQDRLGDACREWDFAEFGNLRPGQGHECYANGEWARSYAAEIDAALATALRLLG